MRRLLDSLRRSSFRAGREAEATNLGMARSVGDAVFAMITLILLAIGPAWLLQDPGTGWHLRLGRTILNDHTVPMIDTLSLLSRDRPWIDMYWLFDTSLAAWHHAFGWGGTLALTILGIAAIYRGLAIDLLRTGRSTSGVVAALVVAVALGAHHFLVRPHLLTLAGFAWLSKAGSDEIAGRPSRYHWSPIVMLVWANVHGGFLAGLSVLGLVSLIQTERCVRGRLSIRRWGVSMIVGLAAVAATLITPYGWGLYEHVFGLLVTGDVTDLIQEYQPFAWNDASALIFHATVVLVLVSWLRIRCRLNGFEIILALTWMIAALLSRRHVPLFGIAVAPWIAQLWDELPHESEVSAQSSILDRWARRLEGAWPVLARSGMVVAGTTVIAVCCLGDSRWLEQADRPTLGLAWLSGHPEVERPFHELEWGGLLVSSTTLPRPCWIDDRFELHGRRAVSFQLDAVEGGSSWLAWDTTYRFDAIWIRPDRPLADFLDRSDEWLLVLRDQDEGLWIRR